MSEPDYASQEASALASDINVDDTALRLAKATVDGAEQDNKHRQLLMTFVLRIVSIALGSVVVFVACSFIWPDRSLSDPVGIAFISAVAAQSFILIGFLARGLFLSASSRSIHRSEPVE